MGRSRFSRHVCVVSLAVVATCASASKRAHGQEPPREPPEQATPSAVQLAKKTQNPISDLIHIPLQSNFNLHQGSQGQLQYILNIEPIVPVPVSGDWLIVTRTIVPVMDEVVSPTERAGGLGDVIVSVFGARKDVGPLTLGVGPALQAPTATSGALGAGKWAIGPTAAIVALPGNWVFGALARNVWSFAGNDERAAVNVFFLQPFGHYNFPGGWAIGTSPMITANWKSASGNQWTVPLGATFSKVIKTTGGPAVQAEIGAFWNVVHPDTGPDGSIRATVALLLPR